MLHRVRSALFVAAMLGDVCPSHMTCLGGDVCGVHVATDATCPAMDSMVGVTADLL